MKKQNLTKFALSIVCAAVLSACGGSSSSSTDTTTPSAAEVEAQKQAAINNLVTRVTAANTANALNLTEEQIKNFAAANYATTFADDALVEALKKFLADSKPSTSDINDQVDVSVPFTNFQIARNNKSNVGLDDTAKTSSDTISFSRGTVEFHHSFDSIVVATPSKVGGQGKTAYLEDFQFNGTKNLDDIQAAAQEVLQPLQAAVAVAEGENTFAGYKTKFTEQLELLKEARDTAQNTYKATPSDAHKSAYQKAEATFVLFGQMNDAIQKASAPAALTDADKDDLAKVYAPIVMNEAGNGLNTKAVAIISETGLLDAVYAANGRTGGKITLSGIYKDKANTKTAGEDRDPDETEAQTETNRVGTDNGLALVYQNDRRVYITADTTEDAAKMTFVNTSGNNNDVRALKNTVAEVYGNKTFTYEVGQGTINEYDQVNDGGKNLPLFGFDAKTKTFDGATLSRVQYGRVTSAIHNVNPADLKGGVEDETVVASYGSYGKDGTENHYFSRGSDHITAENVAELKGTLKYEGHAVSYGLNNKYDGRNSNAIPNAIGSSYKLFSGNHVKATINVAEKTVTGSIFNKWTVDNKGTLKDIALVTFNGDLSANGNITGTSALTYGEKDTGKFAAALYGQNAEELGGSVQSDNYAADKAWGAVFGAIRVADPEAPADKSSPWNPRNEKRNSN